MLAGLDSGRCDDACATGDRRRRSRQRAVRLKELLTGACMCRATGSRTLPSVRPGRGCSTLTCSCLSSASAGCRCTSRPRSRNGDRPEKGGGGEEETGIRRRKLAGSTIRGNASGPTEAASTRPVVCLLVFLCFSLSLVHGGCCGVVVGLLWGRCCVSLARFQNLVTDLWSMSLRATQLTLAEAAV